MGTDIHFIAQRKGDDGKWHDISCDGEHYDQTRRKWVTTPGEFHWTGGRNYYLFAWLADVRNGYGFAGIKTFEPVVPLTSHRGLPPDFERTEEHDLGDHSEGWATFAEILSHPRRQVLMSGVVAIQHYKETVAAGLPPSDWCGDISGGGVVVVDSGALRNFPNATHVRCCWSQPDGLDEFISAVKEVADKYGADNCRLLFGFDS